MQVKALFEARVSIVFFPQEMMQENEGEMRKCLAHPAVSQMKRISISVGFDF